jgi:hypothetical protein
MIVDRQMHVFPADPSGLGLFRLVAGDAVADAIELAQLLDVDVKDLAGLGTLIMADWLGRLERRKPVKNQSLQDATHGGRRNPNFRGDLIAGVALPAQTFDGGASGWRRLARR